MARIARSFSLRESLKVADEIGARTVAFPATSAGIGRWPLEGPPS
ncbi:macro domain-containing protein [Streptomyces tubercidicus]